MLLYGPHMPHVKPNIEPGSALAPVAQAPARPADSSQSLRLVDAGSLSIDTRRGSSTLDDTLAAWREEMEAQLWDKQNSLVQSCRLQQDHLCKVLEAEVSSLKQSIIGCQDRQEQQLAITKADVRRSVATELEKLERALTAKWQEHSKPMRTVQDLVKEEAEARSNEMQDLRSQVEQLTRDFSKFEAFTQVPGIDDMGTVFLSPRNVGEEESPTLEGLVSEIADERRARSLSTIALRVQLDRSLAEVRSQLDRLEEGQMHLANETADLRATLKAFEAIQADGSHVNGELKSTARLLNSPEAFTEIARSPKPTRSQLAGGSSQEDGHSYHRSTAGRTRGGEF